jgi:hypothetical protein
MPVPATPAPPQTLTRFHVRVAMRDFAGQIFNTGIVNVLLDNVEFSDDEIDNALVFATHRYNALTPISNVTQDLINPYVLYLGAVAFLLRAESYRQVRNQATLQDGNVAPIGIDDKALLYSQLADKASEEFLMMAKSIKIQLNMQAAYGGFGSGYRNVARNHHF